MTQERAVERYILATVTIPGGEVQAALGYESIIADDLKKCRAEMTAILVAEASVAVRDILDVQTAAILAARVEARLIDAWPARPWWIEVWNEREALTQVYAPWGKPRTDP